MTGWPQGVGRRVLSTVDSTMAEGARIAPTLAGPEWVLAHAQTAGHGRRGRAWASPSGNFMASLVMRPTEPPEVVALRSFVAALALRDAVQDATGRADGLALKWPNGEVEPGAVPPVSLLSETGAQVTPEDFLDLLAPAYARHEAAFTTYGFAPIRTAWLAGAARLGETITARTGREAITGRFETVDEAGNLVLSTPKGQRIISAAEIFF